MDKGAWWAYSPWNCKKLDRSQQLTLSLNNQISVNKSNRALICLYFDDDFNA